MGNEFYFNKTKVMKALANPVRLMIVDELLEGEKCVCEIVDKLEFAQSHISKNLSILKSAGLIQDRKEGLNIFYSLRCICMKDFFECLNKMVV